MNSCCLHLAILRYKTGADRRRSEERGARILRDGAKSKKQLGMKREGLVRSKQRDGIAAKFFGRAGPAATLSDVPFGFHGARLLGRWYIFAR